eukprot:gb/GECG01000685.1/.p1 GENE.gb/GECG01000685.1/~~gb/GECG01000685.1/.p1  ORF type:complete len:381 (+),score=40.71 gb/GECG01000685.1/:1-1143(+)
MMITRRIAQAISPIARHYAPIASVASRGMATSAKAVTYTEHGDPNRVLSVESIELNDNVSGEDVLIKMLSAPITPTDLAHVEGWNGSSNVSASTGSAKRVGGNEGVAEVVKAGDKAQNIKPGDWVVPAAVGVGTWCTHNVVKASDLCRIEKFTNNTEIEHAGTGIVAPAVATRLLEDFAKLEPGDVIVQNGATSGLSQVLLQLAAERGIVVINIAREHNDWEDLVRHFQGLNNACISVTESYARTPEFQRLLADVPQPKLGVDLVGGRAGLIVAQCLAPDSTLVSVGNMSKYPLPLTADVLLNKNITARGFRLDRWLGQQSKENRDSFIREMAKLSDAGKTKQLLAWEPFKDFDIALKRSQQRGERKVVVVMEPSEERLR